ncbi:MAG: hypothetical protein ACI8ZH_000911 [Flavobacteriales bacterium]|jgi:hypothetical protein
MPKKQLFYLVLIVLFGSLIWFLSTDKKSTISTDNNFSVSDTASVSKIFIADRNGTTITLGKTGNKWIVNNKYGVRKDAIKTILSTINQIKIQRPVPINAFANVVKNLATTGVKVEIYTDKKTPNKTYTIGSSTANHLGTYILMDGAGTPFVVHIPAFNGFLSPRYGITGNKVNEKDWRTRNIFQIKRENITGVSINNIQQPKQSFTLINGPLALLNYSGVEVDFNEEKALALLNGFKLLNCESYKDKKGRIEFATPLHELIVNTDTLRTYAIGNMVNKEKAENFTVKRMYATLNNGELMLIQDYVFNKVLITIDQLQ